MSSIGDFVTERFRDLALLAVVGVAYFEFVAEEWPALPDLPNSSPLLVTAVVLAAVAGLFVGSKVWALLPDPPKVFLVAIRDEDPNGVEVWALTPDTFAETEVRDGTLNELAESQFRAYECRSYDPDANEAVATWRESKPSSELVGKSEVSDALDQIAELRGAFEKEARIGHALRRRIGSIVRDLDRRRAMDQAAALEGHVAPSIDKEGSVDEVLREHLGEMVPGYLKADDERATQDGPDGPEGEAIEFLDESVGDALEPVSEDGGGS